jgi:hypothetical protein
MLKPDIFAWQKTRHFCLALTPVFIKFDYFLINLYPILGKVRGIMTTKCPNANQILESWAEEEWEEYTKGGCYD